MRIPETSELLRVKEEMEGKILKILSDFERESKYKLIITDVELYRVDSSCEIPNSAVAEVKLTISE